MVSLPILALAVASFGIGTTEFVIMGLLPEVARDFGVSIPQAGHLVSGYALGVLPGLLFVATGVALSFTPTTVVIATAVNESHAGLASGLASSATQVGAVFVRDDVNQLHVEEFFVLLDRRDAEQVTDDFLCVRLQLRLIL